MQEVFNKQYHLKAYVCVRLEHFYQTLLAKSVASEITSQGVNIFKLNNKFVEICAGCV
jgi:hypothetical protein